MPNVTQPPYGLKSDDEQTLSAAALSGWHHDARQQGATEIRPLVECTGVTRDANGQVTGVQAVLIPDTKSGTPGSDAVKVKGVITWIDANDALPAEVRLYDRLIVEDHREAGGEDFLENLNTNSLKVMRAVVETSLATAKADAMFQFGRHGTLWLIGWIMSKAPSRG